MEKNIGKINYNVTKSAKKHLVGKRSIYIFSTIKKGEILTQQNLSVKRPGRGMSPMKWDDVVGTKSTKDYNEDEPI